MNQRSSWHFSEFLRFFSLSGFPPANSLFSWNYSNLFNLVTDDIHYKLNAARFPFCSELLLATDFAWQNQYLYKSFHFSSASDFFPWMCGLEHWAYSENRVYYFYVHCWIIIRKWTIIFVIIHDLYFSWSKCEIDYYMFLWFEFGRYFKKNRISFFIPNFVFFSIRKRKFWIIL